MIAASWLKAFCFVPASLAMEWDDLLIGPLPEELDGRRLDSDGRRLDPASEDISGKVAVNDSRCAEEILSMAHSDHQSMASSDSPLGSHGSSLHVSDGQDSDSSHAMIVEEGSASGSEPGMVLPTLETSGPFKIRTSPWFHRSKLTEQAQILIINLVFMLMRCPRHVLKTLQGLMPRPAIKGIARVHSLAGQLVGLSGRRVARCVESVRKSNWQPLPMVQQDVRGGVPPPPEEEAAAGGLSPPPEEAAAIPIPNEEVAAGGLSPPVEACRLPGLEVVSGQQAMRHVVRLALSNLVEGRSGLEYERDATRLSLCGLALPARCQTRHFLRDVEHLAGRIIEYLDAADLHTPLGALGIPSDFGMLMDPVTIGTNKFARHETVLMLCLSVVSPHTHKIHTPMFGGESMGLGGHTGEAQVSLTAEMLEKHPAGLGKRALQARLSIVGGDGAVTEGGPEHRHKSSKAAEKMWLRLHPHAEILSTQWDLFHRADNGAMRAVASVSAVQEIFDVAACMDNLFGIGEGRILLRGVSSHLNEKASTVRGPGGTRKVVFLAGVPGSLITNFKHYMAGLHGRVAWKQAKHGKQTLQSLLGIGQRLGDTSFCALLLIVDDILKNIVRPYALLVQGPAEPWVVETAGKRLLEKLRAARPPLQSVRRMLLIMVLCGQHLGSEEMMRLLEAQYYCKACHFFPALVLHLKPFFSTVPPVFRGCQLADPCFRKADGALCCGPHCQCVAYSSAVRERAIDERRLVQSSIPSKKRAGGRVSVKVPAWVAYGQAGESIRNGHEWLVEMEEVMPRYQIRNKQEEAPAGLMLTTNMFRKHVRQGLDGNLDYTHWQNSNPRLKKPLKRQGACPCNWSSRCHVHLGLYMTYQEVSQAITQGIRFLEVLEKEMEAIFGLVGVTPAMQDLLVACTTCWDWNHLALEKPAAAHVSAFLHCYKALRPFLIHTLWPNPAEFPGLERHWNLSDYEIARQYLLLCRRVREVASLSRAGKSSSQRIQKSSEPARMRHAVECGQMWMKIPEYMVSPVWSFRMVSILLRKILPRPAEQSALFYKRVCFSISQMLGTFEEHTVLEAEPFAVGTERLKPAALAWRSRGKRCAKGSNESVACLSPGCLAQMRRQGRGGVVFVWVSITKAICQVAGAEVSASLDECRFFFGCVDLESSPRPSQVPATLCARERM